MFPGAPHACFSQRGGFWRLYDSAFSSDHDVAVLTLVDPMFPPWAPPPGATEPFAARGLPHRLLDPGERLPAEGIGLDVVVVGYGGDGTGRADRFAVRRFIERRITGVGTTARSDSLVFLDWTLAERPVPGDSGGPLLYRDDPRAGDGVVPRLPAVLGTDVQLPYARLFPYGADASNLAWVRAQVFSDRPGRGRSSLGMPEWALDYGPSNDPDGDLQLDAAGDNCPGVFNPDQSDRDGDGRGDACDACPTGADGDADGDGIADGCDLCPFVPDPEQRDGDHDGVGDACDVCLDVADPAQRNCNADAERAAGAPARGDACDPQPCPDVRLGTSEVDRGLERVSRTDRIHLDALAVAAVDARTGARVCNCSAALADEGDAREACEEELTDGTGGCVLADPTRYRSALPADRGRWELPTVDAALPLTATSTPRAVRPPGGLPLEVVLPYSYPRTSFDESVTDARAAFTDDAILAWDTAADRAALWAGRSAPWRVVLWAHAAGPPPEDPPGPGGLAYYADAVTAVPSATLASRYWSGEVPADVVARRPLPCTPAELPLLLDGPGFPFGAALGQAAWLGRVGVRRAGACVYDALSPWSPQWRGVVPVSPRDAVPGLRPEGFAAPAGARWVAASEPPALLAGTRLRYAAKDAARLGVVGALEVGAGGALVVRGQQPPPPFCDEPQGCGPVEQPPGLDPLAVARASEPGESSGTVSGSPEGDERRDPLLVLSARHEALFYGLGELPGGALAGDLWRIDVGRGGGAGGSGGVTRVALGAAARDVGRVLAATYQPADDALYLLGVRASRETGRGRWRAPPEGALVRLGLRDGDARVLGAWPLVLPHARYALAGADDGSVFLVAGVGGAHVVVRLRADGERLRVLGLGHGAGRLVPGLARAAGTGLTVATVDAFERGASAHHPVAALRPAPRGWERWCF
jgi:hypothetical protein